MYDYMNGIVKAIYSDYISLEVNDIGYKICTANPYLFKEEEKIKVFLYSHIREDENTLYGFRSEEERTMFLKLISVKGLGPKMALSLLSTGSLNGLIDAIEKENILYLTKFPKIGEKLSRQIILDLKGKLAKNNVDTEVNTELIDALSALGYKSNEIKKVVKDLDSTLPIEKQVKLALQLLLK